MTGLLEAHTLLCLPCKAYGSYSPVQGFGKRNSGTSLVSVPFVPCLAGGGAKPIDKAHVPYFKSRGTHVCHFG
jgi:hypothetical protein